MASFDQLLSAIDCSSEFTSEEVASMELEILQALDWEVSLPNSFEISYYLIELCLGGPLETSPEDVLLKAKTLCKALLLGNSSYVRHENICVQLI